MTRAIGDKPLKPVVTSEPEIFALPRPPRKAAAFPGGASLGPLPAGWERRRFVLLCSDGVWDVLRSEEAVWLVLSNWSDGPDGQAAALRVLARYAIGRHAPPSRSRPACTDASGVPSVARLWP